MKRGILITRAQPFHIAHKYITKEMDKADDLDENIFGIGSSQLSYTLHDPFTSDERERMMIKSLDLKKPFHIVKIPDINDYPNWVNHVVSLCPSFDVVYAGGNANYSDINRDLFEEKNYEIRNISVDSTARGTLIRDLMIKDGNWQELVPQGTKEVIYEIKGVKRLKELSGILS